MHKRTHYHTPRTLNEAFGPYAKFNNDKPQRDGVGTWVMAGLVFALIGLLLAWRG